MSDEGRDVKRDAWMRQFDYAIGLSLDGADPEVFVEAGVGLIARGIYRLRKAGRPEKARDAASAAVGVISDLVNFPAEEDAPGLKISSVEA